MSTNIDLTKSSIDDLMNTIVMFDSLPEQFKTDTMNSVRDALLTGLTDKLVARQQKRTVKVAAQENRPTFTAIPTAHSPEDIARIREQQNGRTIQDMNGRDVFVQSIRTQNFVRNN